MQRADGAERSWYWAGKEIFPKIQADKISLVLLVLDRSCYCHTTHCKHGHVKIQKNVILNVITDHVRNSASSLKLSLKSLSLRNYLTSLKPYCFMACSVSLISDKRREDTKLLGSACVENIEWFAMSCVVT